MTTLKMIISVELRKMVCVHVVKIEIRISEAMNIIALLNLILWIFTLNWIPQICEQIWKKVIYAV